MRGVEVMKSSSLRSPWVVCSWIWWLIVVMRRDRLHAGRLTYCNGHVVEEYGQWRGRAGAQDVNIDIPKQL